MEKLRAYLNTLSTDQQKSFAEDCGTTIGYLRKAISQNELVKPITCVRIEQNSSGAVTRHDLHPDDWHLIWPELAVAA